MSRSINEIFFFFFFFCLLEDLTIFNIKFKDWFCCQIQICKLNYFCERPASSLNPTPTPLLHPTLLTFTPLRLPAPASRLAAPYTPSMLFSRYCSNKMLFLTDQLTPFQVDHAAPSLLPNCLKTTLRF